MISVTNISKRVFNPLLEIGPENFLQYQGINKILLNFCNVYGHKTLTLTPTKYCIRNQIIKPNVYLKNLPIKRSEPD